MKLESQLSAVPRFFFAQPHDSNTTEHFGSAQVPVSLPFGPFLQRRLTRHKQRVIALFGKETGRLIFTIENFGRIATQGSSGLDLLSRDEVEKIYVQQKCGNSAKIYVLGSITRTFYVAATKKNWQKMSKNFRRIASGEGDLSDQLQTICENASYRKR
jgi:hypothetical protein